MNKPENVPIATLSGISSLTEIIGELPLPSSNVSKQKETCISPNLQISTEACTLIQRPLQSCNQLDDLTKILSSVNNAYLDFKNSIYNRPSYFKDPGQLPPVLQQVLHRRPNIFQPHFDTYHGSPLKMNAMSNIAYSPNQRTAFLLHQQQQEHLEQPRPPVLQPSPFLQASQFSTGSSSPMRSPHVQQFLKANKLQSPLVDYNNMVSPQLQSPDLRQQCSQQLSTVQLQHVNTHQNTHQNAIYFHAGPSVPQEESREGTQFFSPLKTRGQRQSLDDMVEVPLPDLNRSDYAENVCRNLSTLASFDDQKTPNHINLQDPPKSKKHHHKKTQKENTTLELKDQNDSVQLSKQNVAYKMDHLNHVNVSSSLYEETQQLELRVPKLIVRKVKKSDGNKEFETLEVYSPEKEQQIYQIPVPQDDTNLDRQKRRSSRVSSVDSSESIKAHKRKKTHLISDEEDKEEGSESTASKKYKHTSINGVEGVEVKMAAKKFVFIMDKILDRELELEADGNLDLNDDSDIPPETLLPRPTITSLCSELVKMKPSGLLKEIPTDQLVRMISVMDRHVRDSIQLIIMPEDGEEESKKWYSIQAERIIRSAESAIAILHITTAPGMPKQVFLEEAIEHISALCHFHLENTIYPEFDPIYKLPSDLKDSTFLPKSKRSRTGSVNKFALQIYNKFCEVVSLLGELIGLETLTDSVILKMSQIGIAPFFVEQVSLLQLEALKVARTIFRNYVRHRDLILDDILASLGRLPSNKRNLRSYRLQENVSIQMFTALVLQLVQCTVQIPDMVENALAEKLVDKDVLIVKSYEDALRAARHFMSSFLKKCSSNSRDENDFRPLFENFLHDLFTTANLPEWPAAEVLLTQMGRLFVVTFSNTKLDMSLRSTALDYLAQITTHLRKSALKNQAEGEQEKLKIVVEKLINTKDGEDVPIVEDMEVYDEKLRKSLLVYLQSLSENDSSFKYAREFYLGQWIRDVQMEIEKSMIAPMLSIPGAATKAEKNDNGETNEESKSDMSAEKLQILQEKKEFYHGLVKEKTVSTLRSLQLLNYESATTVIDYLASTRSFSQSFDIYMQQIFKMLSEQAIGLRTKAVKALTMIVSVDQNILARDDVQASVHGRLLDPSTNVREAAVDLIGQFILKSPILISQYYEMLMARILDTGVSVRKRVIKILRDICIEHSDLDKIPDICATMIRRVDDEVGIKKLVTEVFRTLWFQAVPDNSKSKADILYQKAINITKVVALCKDTGFDWLDSLLSNLLDSENQSLKAATVAACQQLVDCLALRLLKTEYKSTTNPLVSCLITLYIFCKSHPRLLIPHATILQPYLSSKVNSATDIQVLQHVSKILELVVPLMDHPNPKFLAELEEDAMKLILKQSQNVVLSCTSCLAAVINKVTHNYKFVVDAFTKLYKFLVYYKREHLKSPDNPTLKPKKPTLLRVLFTAALFCRYFDLNLQYNECNTDNNGVPVSEQVFDLCMYFAGFDDEDITIKAVVAIGNIGIRYPQLLLRQDCKNLYQEILSPKSSTSMNLKYALMKSLQNHLTEEELRLQEAEKSSGVKGSSKNKKVGDLVKSNIKDFGDAQSGTTSEIVQVFLTDIMKSFFIAEKQVRTSALQVVSLVLRQGLVHPAQCIPYLIAISTDSDQLCHVRAEQCLNDLDGRYQGFVHMKAFQGVRMAYDLQTIIQKNNGGYLCGYRENENKISLISHVYGLIRSNKQYRRPFLLSIIKVFDDKKPTVDLLYFLTENLAYLSYTTHEEPLFVIHHVDTTVSIAGANVLQTFKEIFHPRKQRNGGKSPKNNYDDEDDDDVKNIPTDEKINVNALREVVKQSFGCYLLLELKSHLKTVFGLTDSKCQKYSPSEPSKLYDKALNRKYDNDFTTQCKDLIFTSNMESKEMREYYIKFKDLMMTLDTDDESDSEAVAPEKEPIPIQNVLAEVIDSSSLPKLSINIPPVIPARVYEKEKPKSRHSGSRRSSRSSRGSMTHDT